MTTVKDVLDALWEFAPRERKMDFDNVGLLVGRSASKVERILTCLDVTDWTISEAAERGAQLIVAHHPVFFSLSSVNDEDVTGRKIIRLIENNISAVSMHTNLDAADGGVNDALAKKAGIVEPELLTVEGHDLKMLEYSCGRWGKLKEPMELCDYLSFVKEQLGANGLRYHDAGRKVEKVAVVSGSGGSYLKYAVSKGCDTFLTSDIKYDVFLDAKELGINLIDGDHFATENVVVPVLARYLTGRFPDTEVIISEKHCQTARFI